MSNRKIITAAATKGIGYFPATSAASDQYYDNVSLLLTGDSASSYNGYDANWADTSLLLTGDNFTDLSNNRTAITATTVPISKTDPKYTTGSMFFDTTLSTRKVFSTAGAVAAAGFGTGPYTIELWVKFVGTASGNETFFELGGDNATSRLIVGRTSTSKLRLYSYPEGDVDTSTWTSLPVGSWFHFALVRSGATTAYLNGVALGSTTPATAKNYSSASSVSIGRNWDNAEPMSGYLSQIRFTKMARYTSAFTPPTGALPSHRILDSSVYQLPVTTYGNARIDTTTKKFGTGSMYFDGTGDYLSTNAITLSGDFTLECWIYQTAKSSQYVPIISGSSGSYNFPLVLDYNAGARVSGNVGMYLTDGTTTTSGVSVFNLNTWTHIACTRSDTALRLFVNGVQCASATSSVSILLDSFGGWSTGSSGYIFTGYIDDLRITKGYARYTANFTPPTASLPTIPPNIPADPWWGNVSLLLDGNTTDEYDPYWQNVSLMLTGDDFIDWSNQHNAITNNGSTPLSSSIKKYNSSSYDFSSTGRYLSMPTSSNFELLSNNFTIELWAYRTGNGTGDRFIIDKGNSQSFLLRWQASNSLQFYISSTNVLDYPNFAFTLATWYHIAVVRNGNLFTLYINGVSVTTGNSATSVLTTATNLAVCANSGSGGENFQGYLTDIRITKGIARYTANFTPPTAALPSYKIQDRTQNNLTLTPYGNVQLSTDVMRYGTGSMYFDGTGDYISIADTATLNMGTNDFTWECWIYPTSPSNYQCIMTKGNSYTGSTIGLWLAPTTGGFNLQVSTIGTGTTLITINNWYHVAFSKSSSIIKAWLNGIQQFSVADTVDYTTTSFPFTIGDRSAGHPNLNYPFTGYIDDVRITKGYDRYTQNFTPPSQSFATQYISTGYDANYADVSLLLNGNGTNGSQVFTDLSSTPKTVTVSGTATISTTTKKYGTGSINFSGGYLTTGSTSDMAFGTSDFTIELWYNPTGRVVNYPSIFGNNRSYGSNLIELYDRHASSSTVFSLVLYNASHSDPTGLSIIGTTVIATGTWYHLALTRSGSSIKFFVNGIQDGSTVTYSGALDSGSTEEMRLSPNNSLRGYIDDFRITKGIARYTTNFTPPTYQLPTDTTGTVIDPLRSSTSLLLRGNGTNGSTSFTDESPNGSTVTNTDSVTVNTTTKKYGTGSMAFSGSNYLTVPHSDSLEFGTGNFTVEWWMNCSAIRTQGIYVKGYHNIQIVMYNTSLNVNDSYERVIGYSNSSFVANVWYHVAVVRQNGILYIYINGVLDNSMACTDVFTGTAPVYIGADNSDGGISGYFSGYIDDLRVTSGIARYTANFTPPTYEDPIVTGTVYDYNYPQVSLLLNGDGTNGSTVFKDLSSSPKTITATNVVVSTSTKKYGTGSIYINGSASNARNLSIPNNKSFAFPGDFTVEFWMYAVGVSSYSPIIETRSADDTTSGIYIMIHASALVLYPFYSGAPTAPMNTWTYVTFTRSGTSLYCFLNGILQQTSTCDPATYTYSAGNFYIGYAIGDTSYTRYFNGYIDDLRITKGIARYTQNFTPPTAPLPTSYS